MDELAPNAAIGRHETLITLGCRSAGPRFEIRNGSHAHSERAGMGTAGDARERIAQDGRMVFANRGWWERIRSGIYRGERLGVVA